MFQVGKIPKADPSTNWDGAILISPRETWDQRSMRGSACIDNQVWGVVPHGEAVQNHVDCTAIDRYRLGSWETARAPCQS